MIETLKAIYILVALVSSVVMGMLEAFEDHVSDEWLFYFPSALHQNTSMNWFGCFATSAVLIAVMPIYCIPLTIGWIVWWLFHTGRKS